jgi:hypothetical protein
MGNSIYPRRCSFHENWVFPPEVVLGVNGRYVSRVTPRDNSKHVILAVGTYKPKDFAAQMNVQLTNAWGIVRAIVDICRKRPDGKYVLVKVSHTETHETDS